MKIIDKTWAELIGDNRDALLAAMEAADRDAYHCRNMQFTVYLWRDGHISTLGDLAGGNTVYQAAYFDDEALAIACYCHQADSWDMAVDDSVEFLGRYLPDHPAEAAAYAAWIEAERAEGYDPNYYDRYDWLINNASETVDEAEADMIDAWIDETDYNEVLDDKIRSFVLDAELRERWEAALESERESEAATAAEWEAEDPDA